MATPMANGWLAAPSQAAVDRVQYQDVVWTGTRFIATGRDLGAGGVFLDSSDGRTWHRQAPVSASVLPMRLAAGPRGVIAVGLIDDRPATWTSADGLTWAATTAPFAMTKAGTDTISITGVSAAADGWIAVGREDPACNTNCGLEPVRALVWISGDGIHWTRVSDQASLAGAAMTAVARGGPGFVAVGLAGIRAAAWTSSDGAIWSRVPDAASFHELPGTDPALWTSMTGIAAGHAIIVGVGLDGNGGAHGPSGRAWWSADGTTWATADGEDFVSGGEIDVRLTSVAVTPEGYLAGGFSTGRCTGGLWASTDGRAWRCVARDGAFGGFSPYGVAASPSIEVAVGLALVPNPSPDGLPGAVWTRSVP
jgi:hypothetical protein